VETKAQEWFCGLALQMRWENDIRAFFLFRQDKGECPRDELDANGNRS
jgi:hypothetical protein